MERRMESPVTTCISSHNNLNYVKLAYESVRKNAYYKDQPIVIHAENCDDGTDEWLTELDDKNVQVFIEKNEVPRGIGGVEDAPILPTQPGVGDATPTAQWVLDLLSDGVDTNKPLGDGFQSKYDEEITRFDRTTGEYVTKQTTIDAQEYLKAKGYNFIYYPYMACEVARDIAP